MHRLVRLTAILLFAAAMIAAFVVGPSGERASLDAPPLSFPPATSPPPTAPTPTGPAPTVPAPTVPPPVAEVRPGDRGASVQALQRRLGELGFWHGPSDGGYGRLTEQAVMAFQKSAGLPRTGSADRATVAAMSSAERLLPRGSGGDRVEIDKTRQLLLIVRAGRVEWVLNTSTGTEQPYRYGGRTYLADTPEGEWTVSWAVDGIRRGALGRLYRPRYFHRDGIAVHGSPDIPGHPASHGCARVTNEAMDWIWRADLMPIGSRVLVYR